MIKQKVKRCPNCKNKDYISKFKRGIKIEDVCLECGFSSIYHE